MQYVQCTQAPFTRGPRRGLHVMWIVPLLLYRGPRFVVSLYNISSRSQHVNTTYLIHFFAIANDDQNTRGPLCQARAGIFLGEGDTQKMDVYPLPPDHLGRRGGSGQAKMMNRTCKALLTLVSKFPRAELLLGQPPAGAGRLKAACFGYCPVCACHSLCDVAETDRRNADYRYHIIYYKAERNRVQRAVKHAA